MEKKDCILIVDDEKSIRTVIADTLESHGYPVQIAGASDAAIRICEKETIALALVDLKMPLFFFFRL